MQPHLKAVLDEGARSQRRQSLATIGFRGLDADLGLAGADHDGVAAAHGLAVLDDGVPDTAFEEGANAAPELRESLALG